MDSTSDGYVLTNMDDHHSKYNTSWDSQQLCHHLLQMNVISLEELHILREQRIDGLTFLMLKENNLNELGFVLGPKMKILNFISTIKQYLDVNYDLNGLKAPLADQQLKRQWETGCGDTVANIGPHKPSQSPKAYKSYKCRECDKTYSKGQYVRDHEMTVHYNSGLNYSCRVCGQAFGWRVTILKHIKRCHPNKKSSAMIVKLF